MEVDHRQAGVGTAPVAVWPSKPHAAEAASTTSSQQSLNALSQLHASGTHLLSNSFPSPDWKDLLDFVVNQSTDTYDSLATFEQDLGSSGPAYPPILDGDDQTTTADLTFYNSPVVTRDDIADFFAGGHSTRPNALDDQGFAVQQTWMLPWDLDANINAAWPAELSNQTGFTPLNDPTLPAFNKTTDDQIDLYAIWSQQNDLELPQSSTNSSQNSHTSADTKRHSCPTCSMTFKFPKDFRRHERSMRTDQRPLKCPHNSCKYHKKGFSRKDALKRHMETHR